MTAWVFTSADKSRKPITLSGYAAPFGRPRQKAVAMTGKVMRMKRINYPGNSGPPTTHLFGTDQNDFTLEGRWNDRFLGEEGTEFLIQRFEQLIEDGENVQVTWDDLLSYDCILEKIECGRESLTESTWKLYLKVDKNNLENVSVKYSPVYTPQKFADDYKQFLADGPPQLAGQTSFLASLVELSDSIQDVEGIVSKFLFPIAYTVQATLGVVSDTLGDAVGSVTQFGSIATQLITSVDSFADTTQSQAGAILASIHQFRTSLILLQNQLESLGINSFVIDSEAEDDIDWLSYKADSDVATTRILKSSADVEREILISQIQSAKTVYTARTGDTWESISTLQYGTSKRASDIKTANGITDNTLPNPGQAYLIPK